MTSARPIAFDLDRTLFDEISPPDWTSEESVRANVVPHDRAISFVRALERAGAIGAYVTARSLALERVTREALRAARAPAWPTYMRPLNVCVEDRFFHKRAALVRIRAGAYVGDEPGDREAAAHARIPFVHADAIRGPQTTVLAGLEVIG